MDEDRQNSGKGDDMEPKSSRFMPVPEHMLSRSHHSSRENVDDAVVPPPSYTEVVVNRNKYEEPPPETEDVPMADMGEGAEGSELSPEEIAVIMQMRDSRSSYVDGAGREEEAFEMLEKDSDDDRRWTDVAGDLGTVGMESQGVARISSVVDAEEGNAGSHRCSMEDVMSWGPTPSDCCPDCCKSRECQSNTYCETCNPLASCNQGYHVDARFFNLLGVSIPNEVFERYLHIAILEVQKEREFFFRNHTLTVKETERQTKNITNRAKEKLDQGHAEANRIRTVANADKEVIVTNAQVSALKDMYTYLNITRQDYKASVLLVRSLEDSATSQSIK
ncbi:hypothetical protein MAR_023811 [Mya arenaria]|uniref:Uncharacterized protein n=1 Tax=Mya arenaria TaxID=6604 RepID=A0ABY7DQQ3_MYAAR|nr:hypothetical protein MAR_023811 [Mya arenaria]